jgi:hypothetical protein
MKTNILKSVWMIAVILTAGTFFSACSEDEDTRGIYVGSYRTNYEFTSNGQKYTGTYTLTINKSSTTAHDIILNNIDNWSGESVRATVSGNAMTIPQQTIQDVGISGSGTLNGNVLNFSTMETQTGGTQINISQIATKQ